MALHRGDRRSSQFLQGPVDLPVHQVLGLACSLCDLSLCLARVAARSAVGLRISRCEADHPVHGRELRAAHPSRFRHHCLPGPRACGNGAARRSPPGAPDGRTSRPRVGNDLRAGGRHRGRDRRPPQHPAVPDDPAISQPRRRRSHRSPPGARNMALMHYLAVQGGQLLLVLLMAPLLTGFVRKVKARLLQRQGASIIQPYRDLARLLQKDVVLADNASWLFRLAPYLIFAATSGAASLVPTFATSLLFNWTADLIAIAALLGSVRFFLALARLGVGTSFGGIGSSREMMIASLAAPAIPMIVFTLALAAESAQRSTISQG